ncbi:MAG: transketolase, partial [Clostridia bacterium]
TKSQVIALKTFANDIRRKSMKSMAVCGLGHVGGSMSLAETFSVLYGGMMRIRPNDPTWPDRDKIVVSKGHCGPIMYATLAKKGFFPVTWLDTLNQGGTLLPSHTDRQKTPGVDMTTGSLGQGASTACGLAIADRMQGRDSHVFLILGDGELNEGQVWEAMLFIADKKLSNLITLIDYNKMQVDGMCKDVCDMGDLVAKFEAFGLETRFVQDGNDVVQIWEALETAKHAQGRPVCLILNTVKGKDAIGYEGSYLCHHAHISPEQLASCLKHFDAIDASLEKEGAL